MGQAKGRKTQGTLRTVIEDLSINVEELSDEQASLAAGGAIDAGPRWPQPWGPTRYANSCTFNNDTNYGND